MQGLEEVRGLREGEIVGNGARVAAMTIRTYHLWLTLGLSLLLKDYYYVPIASRNLISISVLAQDNYNFYFNKDFCVIYFENKIIAHVFLIDGLYHLHEDANININEQIVNVVRSKKLEIELAKSISGT